MLHAFTQSLQCDIDIDVSYPLLPFYAPPVRVSVIKSSAMRCAASGGKIESSPTSANEKQTARPSMAQPTKLVSPSQLQIVLDNPSQICVLFITHSSATGHV